MLDFLLFDGFSSVVRLLSGFVAGFSPLYSFLDVAHLNCVVLGKTIG